MKKDIDDDTQGYLSDCAQELNRERRKLYLAMAALTDIATNMDKTHDAKKAARMALDLIKQEHQ